MPTYDFDASSLLWIWQLVKELNVWSREMHSQSIVLPSSDFMVQRLKVPL